mmetsp:Transcript_8361/g.19701  ORF Transcript_8361/g.19701 Transcript_8361/m.19701 type:complete len:325 (+) Transcript_8361:36-1010(+)
MTSALAPHITPDKDTVIGLKQLAAVLEVVARLDESGEIRTLGRQVLEERKSLEFQLARRRDLDRRDKETRTMHGRLVEERCKLQVNHAESQWNITHLQDELCMVEREVKHTQETLEALKDPAPARPAVSAAAGADEAERHVSSDTLAKVKKEKAMLDQHRHEIEGYRKQLMQIFNEKVDAQGMQQKLLHRQRQTDQERSNMLIAMEAERRKLAALQVARLESLSRRTAAHSRLTEASEAHWMMQHGVSPTTHSIPDRSAPARNVRADGQRGNQPMSYAGYPAGRPQPEPRVKGVPFQPEIIGSHGPVVRGVFADTATMGQMGMS